jgi:transcriptional regulator
MAEHKTFHLALTTREAEALALRSNGASITSIAAILAVSRSRARQLLRNAREKQERVRAANSFIDPRDCPIELLPIPGNRRQPLLDAGYANLRDLVGLTDHQILHVRGVGRAVLNLLRSIEEERTASDEPKS